jgi:hypothetical protein
MAVWTSLGDNTAVLSQFSRTAFCTQWKLFWDMSVLDVRHGRVLLHRHDVSLMVWDPIADPNADKMQKLPFSRKVKRDIFTAAVLGPAITSTATSALPRCFNVQRRTWQHRPLHLFIRI